MLAASILSADFAHLADEVKHVTDAGVEQIHIEVGDGVFSPDITVDMDLITFHIMTAIPGAAGQPLLKHSLDKIKRLHNMIRENDYNCFLEVDGGVTIEKTLRLFA